jgi:hypothetical protein
MEKLRASQTVRFFYADWSSRSLDFYFHERITGLYKLIIFTYNLKAKG